MAKNCRVYKYILLRSTLVVPNYMCIVYWSYKFANVKKKYWENITCLIKHKQNWLIQWTIKHVFSADEPQVMAPNSIPMDFIINNLFLSFFFKIFYMLTFVVVIAYQIIVRKLICSIALSHHRMVPPKREQNVLESYYYCL